MFFEAWLLACVSRLCIFVAKKHQELVVKGVPQHLIDAGNANRGIRAKGAERKKTWRRRAERFFWAGDLIHFPKISRGQSWVGFDILLLRWFFIPKIGEDFQFA